MFAAARTASPVLIAVVLLSLATGPAAALLLQGAALAFSGPALTQPAALVEAPLAPGVTIESNLAVGAARRYPLMVEAGQYLHVELRDMGPRVGLALLDPNGATVARREVSADDITSLRLLAVAAVTGTYALEVRASGQDGPGRHQIRLDAQRPATERDHVLAAADDALAEATRLSGEGTKESRQRALDRLEAAEAGFLEAADRRGQAIAVRDRGVVQFALGDGAATSSFEQALGLFRALGDYAGEATALNGLAKIRNREGDRNAARALFETAASVAERAGARRVLSHYIISAGLVLDHSGWAEEAIDTYNRGLALATEAGSRMAEGRVLNNMGVAYLNLGDHQKALECYERALPLLRAAGSRLGEVVALGNISNMHFMLKDDAQALALFDQALPLAQAWGLAEEEAQLLKNVAKVHRRLGDYGRAVESGRRSVELWRKSGDREGEAEALRTLGRVLHASGDLEAAREHLLEALRILPAIGERFVQAEALFALAQVERDRGNLPAALAHAEACVTLTEKLREATTNPDLRGSFLAAEHDKYGLYIDVLMRLHEREPAAGHDDAALQMSERARARLLLEALIESRADIRQGLDPGLLDRERELQKQLKEAEDRLSRALAQAQAGEEVAAARRAFEATSDTYRQAQSRIRQESPRYATLTQPVPATVEQIRREVLDDDTVLLEYYLGEDRSFLWAVTRSALVSQVLPARAEIEGVARRVYALLTERQRTRAPAAVREADQGLESEMAALGRLLLGGVATRLGTEWKGKRLLVVASSALAYVPFGALPSPVAGAGQPLLGDHEVVFAPSASVLVALRQEQTTRAAAGNTVAVIADPVFEAGDPRVQARTTNATRPAVPTGLTRAMDSLGRGRFTRLPFSRGEADAIAAFVPGPTLLKATDFAASRDLVAADALGDRRIVHFATHGVLNSEHPDLSGLVLSLVDEQGRPRDGFLRMREIYNLRLPADLVVLSACQTALGREIRGEGLVGLTRGFMYAGARRVVASLWQVDDESTAELMKLFYRAMLKDGRPPASALRTAQLEMSRSRRWAAPFYWAGFVLQGEWQ